MVSNMQDIDGEPSKAGGREHLATCALPAICSSPWRLQRRGGHCSLWSSSRRGWITVAVVGLTACATSVDLPERVQTVPGTSGGRYIERIDFSYTPAQPRSFSQLKLCIAEHVHDKGATLRDSAGSFVGAATGTYYQIQRNQAVSGGPVFKYIDEGSTTLVASGLTRTASSAGLVVDLVRFDLKAATGPQGLTLVFSQIARAQENTGGMANDGFGPVGAWPGARAPEVYTALEQLAGRLKACLG